MGTLISVSKASKLLGMSRSDFNDRLQASDVTTFEGKVDLDEVKAIAPEISLCQSEILDRVRYIRENTEIRDHDGLSNMSTNDLVAQVNKLTTDLMVERSSADHYEGILIQLARKLGELQSSDNEEVKRVGQSLCEWLREEIASQ